MKLIVFTITLAALSIGLADRLAAQAEEKKTERERALEWIREHRDDPYFAAIAAFEERKKQAEIQYWRQQQLRQEAQLSQQQLPRQQYSQEPNCHPQHQQQPLMVQQQQQRMLEAVRSTTDICCFPAVERTGPWYLTPSYR